MDVEDDPQQGGVSVATAEPGRPRELTVAYKLILRVSATQQFTSLYRRVLTQRSIQFGTTQTQST